MGYMRIRGRFPIALTLALTLLSARAVLAQFPLGPEMALSRPASPGAVNEVAVAEDGSFVAVWASVTGPPRASDVFYRLFGPDGRPRGFELTVANQGRGQQSSPQIAMAKDGSFVITWAVDVQGRGGVGINRVYARRFDRSGRPRGGPFPVTVAPTLGPNGRDGQDFPGVAIAPDGRIVVFWTNDTGRQAEDGADFFDLKARWFADDGHSLGDPFGVATRYFEAELGRARFDRDGTLVVAFQGHNGESSFFDVYLQRFDTQGAPRGEAVRINNDPETVPGSQLEPDFAFGADGSLFVVWTDRAADSVRHPDQRLHEPDSEGVVAQRVAASFEPLGPPVVVNRFFLGAQERPAVATTSDGGFFVVWQSGGGQDGSGSGVFGRRFDATGTAVSRELTMAVQRTNDQQGPRIALNAHGRGVIAWTTFDPHQNKVVGAFGRLFGP